MTRKVNLDGIESAPRWIVMFLGAYSIVHLFVLYLWNAAGQAFSIQGTSDGTSALSVTGMAAVGLWLCLVALRSFPKGAKLRSAWVLMTIAAAAQTAWGVLAQLPGTGLTGQIRMATLIAGGPMRLAVLAAAMLAVLRILRKFGFQSRPSATDWAVSGIAGLFTLCRFGEAAMASLAGKSPGVDNWISLSGLPILCVLLFEAMLLRQSVLRMGNGLIARCWIALVWGILLTGAGELALWVIPHDLQSLPLAMFGTLFRLPIAAAFALVPAYQVAAQRRATHPAGGQPEDLPAGVPALAR
jgi:hypothetical protein